MSHHTVMKNLISLSTNRTQMKSKRFKKDMVENGNLIVEFVTAFQQSAQMSKKYSVCEEKNIHTLISS